MNRNKDDFKFVFISAMFIGLMIASLLTLVMSLGEDKVVEYIEIKTNEGKTYKVSKDLFIEFTNNNR